MSNVKAAARWCGIGKNSRRMGQPVTTALRAEALRRLLIRHGDARGQSRQHAVGEARLDVGLENHGGNAMRGGQEHHRTRSVAAHAERRSEAVAVKNFLGVPQIRREACAALRSNFRPPMPFSPAARINSSGNPACGTSFASIPRSVPTNTTRLSPRCPSSRASAAKPFLRDGQRRKNVPAGAAAGDQ